jgi:hypothetical protein
MSCRSRIRRAQRFKYPLQAAANRDGEATARKIFYLDVNTLMAADVSVDHSQLKVGLPKRLFQFRYTGLPRSNYAVTPDGQRFLFITRAEASLSEPITVVVNWDRQP